jgi:hypothetical protein
MFQQNNIAYFNEFVVAINAALVGLATGLRTLRFVNGLNIFGLRTLRFVNGLNILLKDHEFVTASTRGAGDPGSSPAKENILLLKLTYIKLIASEIQIQKYIKAKQF